MSFVPEWSSYCIQMTKSTDSAVLKDLENDHFVRHLENDTHAPLAPDYTVCGFNSERSSFSVYMIPEWNVIPEREFHSDWKPEWLMWERNFVSVSCKQVQRNIWGWNELVLEWKSFRYHVNGPLVWPWLCLQKQCKHLVECWLAIFP